MQNDSTEMLRVSSFSFTEKNYFYLAKMMQCQTIVVFVDASFKISKTILVGVVVD